MAMGAAPGIASALNAEDDAAILEYSLASPLMAKAGLNASAVRARIKEIREAGKELAGNLGLDASALPPAAATRVFGYYIPVFLWVQDALAAHRKSYESRGEPPPPLVVGISAPQGCGKTTLVEQLESLLNRRGQNAVSLSLDDVYLTGEAQDAVAAGAPTNDLLQSRGNAGTHDLDLARRTLAALRGLVSPAATTVPLPRYNKSFRAGRGDRAPRADWPTVASPLSVVLLEGWMLGFAPVPPASAAAVHPGLVDINDALADYGPAVDAAADAWIVVRIGDPAWVYRWRLQAEHDRIARGQAGLSDADIAAFVGRFMPAYTTYLPGLYRDGPAGAAGKPVLQISVDEHRSPLAQQ